MIVNYEGRDFEITDQQEAGTALKPFMLKKGLDGFFYFGTSKPVGRQRKTLQVMFTKNIHTGKFDNVL